MLLRETERLTGIIKQFADCFTDHRDPELIEHTAEELIAQRIYALALGYADLNDHDDLRHDPLLAVLVGQLDPLGQQRLRQRDRGKALAGKSTLNRLELTPVRASSASRYKKITVERQAIQRLFTKLFLQAHERSPQRIVLDLDATDDTIHGHQSGRFFHGYYRNYCYLPLYIFCGEHLLCARLRPANIDAAAGRVKELERIVAQIRAQWPRTRIVIRADSGFCREEIMAWCEANDVDFVLGLAKNERLIDELAGELAQAKQQFEDTGQAARVFKDFSYQTRESWSRARRVIGKAEQLAKGSNPRFVVTSLPPTSSQLSRCMKLNTVPGARWKTGSRNSSCTCSPTGPARRRCGPTSCGCGFHRWRIRCWRLCAGWACRGLSWPGLSVARSGSSCSSWVPKSW